MPHKTSFLNLQPSEATVVQAASRIYSAYVISNRVTDDNELKMIEKAVSLAVNMAQMADEMVKSDDELT